MIKYDDRRNENKTIEKCSRSRRYILFNSAECNSANITEVAIRANSYIDNFLEQHRLKIQPKCQEIYDNIHGKR